MTLKSYELSIIVPCYNSEAYILECITSLVNECKEIDVEYVFVNDGSTDNTVDLIKESIGSNKFKLVEQINNGVSSARNNGLKHCSGKYIMFLDSDDILLPGFYEGFFKNAFVSELDLIVSEYITFTDPSVLRAVQDLNIETYPVDDFLKGYIYDDLIKKYSVCSTLYNRKFLIDHQLKFDESLAYAEDQYFLLNCIRQSKSIRINDFKLIAYRQHSESVTKSFNLKRLQTIKVFEKLKSVYPEYRTGFDFRINKELMSILMFYSRANNVMDTITFYRKYIKPKTKRVKAQSFQMFVFLRAGLFYAMSYKLVKLFK